MGYFHTNAKCFLKIGLATLILLFNSTILFAQSGLCDPATPFYNVDLSANPDSSWVSPPIARVDHCCGVTGTDRCVEFLVTLSPDAVALSFDVAVGAAPPSWFYQVNCGPQIPFGTPLCITGPGPYTITFCKPGANLNTYEITSIAGPTGTPDKTIGNGCNTTMSISGVITSSITWTSIFPGATGAYDSYLSCTNGCSTTTVTAQTGHPAYVDYRVCGNTLAVPPCIPPGTFCDTIRVYMSTPLLNTVNPNPAIFCANNPSVILTGIVNGGVPAYTYAWTNAANGAGTVVGAGLTYTATSTGNYSFIVYDQNYPACPAPITNVNVTSSPVPAINAGPDQTTCGTALTLNGSVTGATGGIWTGGNGTFTPGNTTLNATYTPTLTELTNGTVILTLTSTGNGACNPVSDQVVLFISTPIIATISSPPVVCYGQTATITVNATGGVGPYTYFWFTGQTTQSISNVLPGTYNVTVTGGSPGFCTANASITLNTNPQIIVTTSPNNAISCSSTATISASATGGTGILSYLWSNGATTSSTNVNTGTYTITVTDAVGCSASNSLSVTASSTLIATVNQPAVICNGGSTTLTITPTGGLGGNSFSWTNAATTTSITVGAGNYCATVTDLGGCIASACATVTANPPLVVSIPTPPVICNGSSATVNAAASGGQAPYTFLWNTGQTSQSLAAPAGTYTVTVTDFIGCTNASSVTIFQAPSINIAVSAVGVGCFGGNNGSATAIVSGGVPSYFYSWAPFGGSSATANNLIAGTYTVTITDTIGCSSTAMIIVNEPFALAASITIQNQVSCNGGNNGAAIVNATNGTPAYSYAWNPTGGTIQNPVNLGAGSYTVTVTDAKGCTKTVQTNITEPPPLTASIISITDIGCNGGSTGSASISAAGGTPAYSYSWTPGGGTNATATNLLVGTYTVTITDLKSCTAQLTIAINQPPPLTSIISSSSNLSCNGGSDGTATVAASGGTGPYSYAWNTSPVQTTATATNLSAGTYYATVTDSTNCTTTSPSVIISSPPSLIATASPSALIACTSTITISSSATGGTGGYSYLWNTGAISSSIIVNTGTYIITITDGAGCSASDSVSVLASNSTLTAAITQPPNICYGSSASITVNVSGGLGSNTYLWNTGATASSISAIAGNYCVTVTDLGGCITNACVNVIQNPLLSITIATPPDICQGATTTITAIGAGGQSPYSYLWSNGGATTPSIIKPAGTYTVTISDATGNTCSASATVTINAVTPINAAMSFTNVSCFGASNGTASVYASGGASGYSYSWSPSGGTNSSLTQLGPGIYTVTVTDAIGCIKTGNVTIIQPVAPVALTITHTNNLCFGDSIGTATAFASGGTAPYYYYWSLNGDTTITITGLPADTYTATIADITGCSISSSVIVSEPSELTFISTTTQISCFGGNGSVALAATGGTGTLVITGDDTTNLIAGTYNYTVTDSNGCSRSTQAIVNPAPSELTLVATPSQINCFGGTGSVTLISSGGTGTLFISGDPITNLAAGSYNYTVTDSNGCVANTSATINAVTAVSLTATPTQISCFGGTGIVELSASGGTGLYTITGDDTINLVTGTYNYTVADANGCTANASASISYAPAALTFTATAMQINCFGGTGSVGLSASGGTGTLSISGDDTTGLVVGTYNYTLTDANGCTSIAQAIINPEPSVVTLTATVTQISCFGGTGSVALSSAGGTGTLVISGDSTNNLIAGTYNYSVTDSNGCIATTQAIINAQPAVVSLTAMPTQISCFGGSGSVELSMSGGIGTLNVTGDDTTNLSAGTYYYTLTDANGCIANDSATINSGPTLISISDTTTASTCGLNNGSATALVSGGTGPYNYSWAPSGGTNAIASNLFAGNYIVTVTDSNACQKQLSLSVLSTSFLIADFTSTEVCLTNPTQFTDSSTTSSGSSITTWEWDFGNSTPLNNSPNPVYIYPAPGIYNVSLTVTSSNGCVTTVTQPVTVHFLPDVNFSSINVCLNSSTLFTDLSTVQGGDSISSLLWNFGDSSSPETISNPSHTYNMHGTYNILLLVTTNFGCMDTISKSAIVYPPPIAQFIVDDSDGCVILCPHFTDNSDPISGTITNWQWNFGDGSQIGTTPNEEHCYTNSGFFTVSLTVTTSNGCVSTITQNGLINVYQAPVAAFDYSPQPASTLASEIYFNNLSQQSTSWLWDFGDINDSTGSILQFPSHDYSEAGNYCIMLIAQNNFQCIDTIVHCLQIDPEFTFFIPNAFTPNESSGTNDLFSGYGTNISKYDMWIFDRWGNMIFHTDDLRIGWDGRANKGKEIAQRDVYVYLVELLDFKGNKHQYRGIVTLVR